MGPTSGLPSGVKVKGPVDDLLQPRRSDGREMGKADFEARRDAVEVVGQQVLAEVPRA